MTNWPRIIGALYWFALVGTAIFIIFMRIHDARAGDDPLHVGHTHEGEVGEFYMSWRQPLNRDQYGARIQSCCGGTDCRPILEMRKGTSTQWEVYITMPYSGVPLWVAVPDGVWEDLQPDPRESPDERGHVCALYSGKIVCAVRTPGL